MSTGLTYVNITDTSIPLDPQASGSYVFSSYEEAYNFGDWYCRYLQTIFGSLVSVYVAIYTTTPNNSGYFAASAATPSFTVFD
jgi:hypothetical protein